MHLNQLFHLVHTNVSPCSICFNHYNTPVVIPVNFHVFPKRCIKSHQWKALHYTEMLSTTPLWVLGKIWEWYSFNINNLETLNSLYCSIKIYSNANITNFHWPLRIAHRQSWKSQFRNNLFFLSISFAIHCLLQSDCTDHLSRKNFEKGKHIKVGLRLEVHTPEVKAKPWAFLCGCEESQRSPLPLLCRRQKKGTYTILYSLLLIQWAWL